MRPLLVVGSSGHASVVLEAIALQTEYEVVGLLDSFQPRGTKIHGYHIIGPVENACKIAAMCSCFSFFVAVGDNWRRDRISAQILVDIPNAEFATVVHPHASVAKSAGLGTGSVVIAGAILGTNCRVGRGCIINTACSVDHDCVLGDFSSIGPGAHLGGTVSVGPRSSVGIGSAVRQKITIGGDTVVGAGAVVVKDIAHNAVAYGVPARLVRHRSPDEAYL